MNPRWCHACEVGWPDDDVCWFCGSSDFATSTIFVHLPTNPTVPGSYWYGRLARTP